MGDKTVYAVAASNTYDIVIRYGVHDTPAMKPYPIVTDYMIPIKRGGVCEYIYQVIKNVEVKPRELHTIRDELTFEQYKALCSYYVDRLSSVGFKKADEIDAEYRFYILEIIGTIQQPFYKKNIQISVKIDYEDISLLHNRINKIIK